MEIIDKPLDWTDLTNLPEKFRDVIIIYRGVVNYKYDLIPAIGRPRAKVTKDGKKNLNFENTVYSQLLDRFKREATLHLDKYPTFGNDTDEEWEFIARHHGLPTRLLDWTKSQLIAAYFACEKSGVIGGDSVDAAIYGLKITEHVSRSGHNNINLNKENDVWFYVSQNLSKRVTAQRGIFTIHDTPQKPFDSEDIIKWKIESNNCGEIRYYLNKCGISRETLFPDLDGIAENLRWLYKFQLLDL